MLKKVFGLALLVLVILFSQSEAGAAINVKSLVDNL